MAKTSRVSRKTQPAVPATTSSPATAPTGELVNRELSWLEFNRRVLHEAADPRTPLLERLNFLAIFSSNLDEFFMKRVGGLKRQVDAGVVSKSNDGLTPAQQLAAVRETVLARLSEQAAIYADIRKELAAHDVHLLEWEDLTKAEQADCESYFRSHVFPVLTPLAVDPGHPFPFISNLSTSLGVMLRPPSGSKKMFARVKVPEVLSRWIPLKKATGSNGTLRFLNLIDLIQHNLDDLFPGMVVLDVMPFRISRSADVEREEEDADDLLEMIEDELRRRRFEKPVRLEHGPKPSRWILDFLKQELGVDDDEVYEAPGALEYTGLRAIYDVNLPQLKYEPFTPVIPPALADEDIDLFSLIRRGDLLVHHPYESFNASVERFIRTAVNDPNVLAIKMTVYRTGDDSPFIPMLIRAAEEGKQVVCLVELKARFDEERNINLAQSLEKAGVHVVYGIVGLKTHTKTALVVRQDPDGLRCYAHIGTGNYNVRTAKLYTDLSLLTCRPELTDELVELYNHLTGRSLKQHYDKLLVAPINMKDRFLQMIDREVEHHRAGRPARIVAKMNSLEDTSICRALYDASAAGVPIDLIVRGFCCLRPGVPGLSENIRVISVIGRFLEHSRIFFFQNGHCDPLDGEFYIGSADWMYRNLLARIEVITPVDERTLRQRCWEILQIMLNDRRQAWDMRPDGITVQRTPTEATGLEALGTQQGLIEVTRSRYGKSHAAKKAPARD